MRLSCKSNKKNQGSADKSLNICWFDWKTLSLLPNPRQILTKKQTELKSNISTNTKDQP